MTNSEAFTILQLTDEDEFSSKVSSVFEQGRGDSLRHKLSLFVESDMDYDWVTMNRHIVTIFHYSKGEMEQNDPLSISLEPIHKFRHYDLHNITFKLYNPIHRTIKEDELIRLNEYFNKERQYLGMALILQTMLPYVEYEERCAITEHIIKWRENFIDRFIQEVVQVSPFATTTLEVISVLRTFPRGYWIIKFPGFLLSHDDPIEWMYRFFKYENGELKWNSLYYHHMNGDNSLSTFTYPQLDLVLPEEILDDIRKQHIGIDTPLTHKNISGSVFLSSALDWWQNR